MKNFLLFSFFLICTLSNVDAEILRVMQTRLPSSFNRFEGQPVALKHVAELTEETGIKVSYQIPNIEVIPDSSLYTDSYFWRLSGFGESELPGTPSYPVRTDVYSIPGDASDITLSLGNVMWRQFSSHTPTPARHPLSMDNETGYTFDNVPPLSADSMATLESPAFISGITKYRDRLLVQVTLNPCVYDELKNTTKVVENFSFDLKYNTAEDPRYIITTPYCPENYLILTLNDSLYTAALQPFVEWKKMCGSKVYVRTIEGRIKTANERSPRRKEIKDIIQQVYQSDKDLMYVIFAGTDDVIPGDFARYTSKDNKRYYSDNLKMSINSDYYYMCMDGEDDEEADLMSGRFYAKNAEELSVIVNKIVNYEMNPVQDDSFYDNVLHLAYFEDRKKKASGGGYVYPDGIEDLFMVHTSEYLRESAMMHGKNVSRIYTRTPNVTPRPKYMVSATVGTVGGSEILLPAELLSNSFNWYSTPEMITLSLNQGKLYALYCGHGHYDGWSNPEYKEPFAGLKNGNKLPVIFSDACSTGQFYTNSMAATLLTKSDGGAVAVIAAEQPVMGRQANRMFRGIFNEFWKRELESDTTHMSFDSGGLTGSATIMGFHTRATKSETEIQRLTLGKMLHKSYEFLTRQSYGYKNEHDMGCREMFHIFGDPGMVFHTEKPQIIKDVHFSIEDAPGMQYMPTVRLDAPALITYYGDFMYTYKRLYGDVMGCMQFGKRPYVFTVQRYNHVPFIIRVNEKGEVWTSAPLADDGVKQGKLMVREGVPGRVIVEYALATSEFPHGSEVELRDFSNNLIVGTSINEDEGTIELSSPQIIPGMYVVTLREANQEPIYRKISIK